MAKQTYHRLLPGFDKCNYYLGMENPSHKKLKQVSGKRQYQGVVDQVHKKAEAYVRENDGEIWKRFDSSQMEMGGPGKGAFTRYDHQKKPSSKPSSSKPVSSMPSRYLRMQDEELHVEETRNSFSPSQSRGRRVTTRNQEEQYLHEHYHEYETRNSFSPPQKEQQHEGDSIQTETCMSDDEDEEENIGSTSHVTRKETRALGETRKIRLNKGSLVFEVDESFGRIIGKNSQGFITKGGCVMRKYAKLDGTTWKKQPDLLITDIISKTTENSDFDFKCTRMRSAMSSQLGYQHRNHQYKLHLHYKEYETMEEAMTHPPKGIEVSDWVLLCERFASEDFQKISEKNKKNRSKNLVPPTVGTRSLARRVDEVSSAGEKEKNFQKLNNTNGTLSKKLKGWINEEGRPFGMIYMLRKPLHHAHRRDMFEKALVIFLDTIKGRLLYKQILETSPSRLARATDTTQRTPAPYTSLLSYHKDNPCTLVADFSRGCGILSRIHAILRFSVSFLRDFLDTKFWFVMRNLFFSTLFSGLFGEHMNEIGLCDVNVVRICIGEKARGIDIMTWGGRGSNHRKKQGLSGINATPADSSLNTGIDTTGTVHISTVEPHSTVPVMDRVPSSYANKLCLTSSSKENL
ncbi:hypothetical protein Tco_1335401 [Tanacetum coccineum]